jgi:hypothetical protein
LRIRAGSDTGSVTGGSGSSVGRVWVGVVGVVGAVDEWLVGLGESVESGDWGVGVVEDVVPPPSAAASSSPDDVHPATVSTASTTTSDEPVDHFMPPSCPPSRLHFSAPDQHLRVNDGPLDGFVRIGGSAVRRW